MHHLQHPVVKGGNAGHDTAFADRQELFQKIPARVEVREDDFACVIARIDLIGRARPVWRRGLVAVDRDQNGGDCIGNDIAQLRARAAVDRAARQMEQQIDHARRFVVQKPREQLGKLRPDAG